MPEINNQPDPDCYIEHMTNNYYDKFSELKSQNFNDIRGVCTIKINEVIYENKIKEKKNYYFVFRPIFKNFFLEITISFKIIKKMTVSIKI